MKIKIQSLKEEIGKQKHFDDTCSEIARQEDIDSSDVIAKAPKACEKRIEAEAEAPTVYREVVDIS